MPKVYKIEEKLGLGDLIRERSSIVLTASIKPGIPVKENLEKQVGSKTLKADADTWSDLYPFDSVLVTTGGNLNQAYFDHKDMWAARHTPKDKPINIEHDENNIVGHMVGSLAVDENYDPIGDDSDVDALPDIFHILDSGVIYRNWRDDDKREEIEGMLEEIANDEWAVSMECVYDEFDYATQTKDGVFNFIARDDTTAFLTQHLKQFKGTGKFAGKNIYIVPRKFVFSGKGLTRNPANPKSVILSSTTNEDVVIEETQQLNAGEINMDLEKQIAELKAELATSKVEYEKLKASHVETASVSLKAEIDKLKLDIDAKSILTKAYETEIASLKTEKVSLENDKATIEKSVDELKSEVASFKAEQVTVARKDILAAAKFDEAKIKTLLVSLASLDDKTFAETVEVLKPMEAKKDKADDEEDEVAKKDKEEKAKKDKKDKEDKDKKDKMPWDKASKDVVDGADVDASPMIPTGGENRLQSLQANIEAFLGEGEVVDRSKAKKTKTK